MNGLLVTSFLNALKLICLHTSIAIVSNQLNVLDYCHVTLIILFNISHMFADREVVTSITIYV